MNPEDLEKADKRLDKIVNADPANLQKLGRYKKNKTINP